MGNRFQKVLIAQGSERRSVLSLGQGEGTTGHLGAWKRSPSGGPYWSHTSHHFTARERPTSPAEVNLGSCPDPWAYVFLSHFNWGWRVPFGNLGKEFLFLALLWPLKKRWGEISDQTGTGGGRGRGSSL